jgi:biopolymer transport protein ExbD
LIDLAFALLIIFMITTPLLEQTVELNLPVEAAKTQAEDREDFQSISIDRAGAYYWGEGPGLGSSSSLTCSTPWRWIPRHQC